MSGGSRKILSAGLPLLVSELHTWPEPGLIVLDDAHQLTDQTALDAISGLIDHLPAGFRMAIVGRYQPHLPFARLAANRDLIELGADALALDATETGELVHAAGCELSLDEIGLLNERTEGWAVGVYLATRALGRSGANLGQVASFHGTDGHVAAYIRSELQDELDSDDLAFLARTSVLARVSPAIAEAITDLPEAGQRLRKLSKHSLLVQELAADEPTYRYHNLLREFLLLELETREPGATARMHRHASAWYHAAGDVDLAIEHALAGDDFDTAARYVTAAAYAAHQHGRTATLDRWLTALDVKAITRHPPLAVIAAWVYLLTGRGDEADAMADVRRARDLPRVAGRRFCLVRLATRDVAGDDGPLRRAGRARSRQDRRSRLSAPAAPGDRRRCSWPGRRTRCSATTRRPIWLSSKRLGRARPGRGRP